MTDTGTKPDSVERCPYCEKPDSAGHWRSIARAWEGLVAYALVFGVVVGAGAVGILWAAVAHR